MSKPALHPPKGKISTIVYLPVYVPTSGDILIDQKNVLKLTEGEKVRLRSRVTHAWENCVEINNNENIVAGTVIWTSGVAVNPRIAELNVAKDIMGRVLVNEFLADLGRTVTIIFASLNVVGLAVLGYTSLARSRK